MAGSSAHEAAVTEWLQRATRGSFVEIIEAFDKAFIAVWRRAQLTLGEVTLTAIVERVLRSASDQYPVLAAIGITEAGLRCVSLRTVADVDEEQVRAALRFVLVELLTVLGNLTAEILSSALHDTLLKSHVPTVGNTEKGARRP